MELQFLVFICIVVRVLIICKILAGRRLDDNQQNRNYLFWSWSPIITLNEKCKFYDQSFHEEPGMFETKPPLCSMLPRSVLGSWSVDICTARPPLERTARESPTLATHSRWPSIKIAVTAVDPPRPKSELCERIAWSVLS